MMTRSVVVALFALTACKGGDDKSLEPAVFGKAVAPPGDLGKLKIGMPVPEAKKAAGKFIPSEKDVYKSFPSGYSGMKYAVGLDDAKAKIDRIRIELPANGKDTLAKAWGAPVEATCMDEPCWYWFDPATQIRAKGEMEQRRRGKGVGVEFHTYMPIEKLLGAKPGTLGFEATPVVGASLEDLRKNYAAVLTEEKEDVLANKIEQTYLTLPPTPYEAYWTRVHLNTDGKRVTGLRINMTFRENLKAKDEYLAAFDKAWGKGTEVKDYSERTTLQWNDPASGRRAHLDATMSEGAMDLEVDSYWPVEKFLGDAPDKLGWETTPLIGLTDAELEKAYPDYLDKASDGSVMLKAPATEWDDYTLIQFHKDDAGKVQRVVFSISYRKNPASRDAIKAALHKKWGAGAEVDEYGRKLYVLREANPRVVAEESDISKAWDLKIGSD